MSFQKQLADALRILSMDAVQAANSGHPGAPMGMADIAQVLWMQHLQHNPQNPQWCNRDRFVLSNGHSAALLYSLLHLSGYEVSLEDLQQFRQLGSKTPGHPEFGYTAGVEATTGPLGQGLANAVGMAIAEKNLASQFNKNKFPVVDHHTYVFLGDGCLMEGISHEAASLAGTLGLGKLIVIWDDNSISIDGKVNGWWQDNTPQRFAAYNWQVIPDIDGHDSVAIDQAIKIAKANTTQPSLICAKTIIGKGSPNQAGSHACHGAPLGATEIAATREALQWTDAKSFSIPEELSQAWSMVEAGAKAEQAWQELFANYQAEYPELAAELTRRLQGNLPANFTNELDSIITDLAANPTTLATRKASYNVLCALEQVVPELLGGSADLTPSNLTKSKNAQAITATAAGNYLHYGVREFGMSAVMNGIALHGGFIPFGGTFLVFMEYARNAVRMAALMQQKCIFVYTHDSIGLGEDGPTHQPIEQLANLRFTPNMTAWRPCDQVETAVAWKMALANPQPTSLILSRQNLPQQARNATQLTAIEQGGYILHDTPNFSLIIIATGSEVALAMDAATKLQANNIAVRVVSMPSTDVFDAQDQAYKDTVLPASATKRLAIEAAKADFWYKYVGLDGKIIGMDSFGESAPAGKLFEHFGFTVTNVVDTVMTWLD